MIVMNTLTGAVSEYDWLFQSITPTHAGDASGLYLLGGDMDAAQRIHAEIMGPKTLIGESTKSRAEMVYFSVDGTGDGIMTVRGKDDAWEYDFPLRDSGESRCQPGKGIRENYLAFGFSKPDGEAFTLDRIEVLQADSKQRRVS